MVNITHEERKRELLEIKREIDEMEGIVKKIFDSEHQILGILHWHRLNGCIEEIRESLEILEEKVCPECLFEYCECEEYANEWEEDEDLE